MNILALFCYINYLSYFVTTLFLYLVTISQKFAENEFVEKIRLVASPADTTKMGRTRKIPIRED